MTVLNQVRPSRVRGDTIPFTTTFYSVFNSVAQPVGTPQVVISYPLAAGGIGSVTLPMTAPGGTMSSGIINTNASAWMALWDSRNAGPGIVSWSIETPGSPPVSVEDGQFTLVANAANRPTF